MALVPAPFALGSLGSLGSLGFLLPGLPPAATTPRRSTLKKIEKVLLVYVLPMLLIAGMIAGTYFCAHELSHPSRPSHTPVVVALVGLCGFDISLLAGLLSCLVYRLPPHTAVTRAMYGPPCVAVALWGSLLFFWSGYCCLVATYFVVEALVTGSSMALIVVMFPLGVLDLLVVRLYIAGLRDLVTWWRRPKKQAERMWQQVSASPGVETTREVVMTMLEGFITAPETRSEV